MATGRSARAPAAVYVFCRGAAGWTEEAKLDAPDAASNDGFGAALAIGDPDAGGFVVTPPRSGLEIERCAEARDWSLNLHRVGERRPIHDFEAGSMAPLWIDALPPCQFVLMARHPMTGPAMFEPVMVRPGEGRTKVHVTPT